MTKNPYEDLRKIVNASGFLFQLRIKDEIHNSFNDHKWEISSHEHPWKDKETGTEGFIDLVIKKDVFRIIIECKRPRDANWIFLISSKSNNNVIRARCLWTFLKGNIYDPSSGWRNFEVLPFSKEAEFCLIRGQGEKDKPMLERLASNLLNAVDSLAAEELNIRNQQSQYGSRVYFPVIVTTAKLQLCEFNSDEILLEDGTLPYTAGQFKIVPYIRFHKSLTTKLSPNYHPPDIMSANQDKERTIFIVNAQELINFLDEWKLNQRKEDMTFWSSL